ncbi:MAG: aldehyde dehydrogenase family protein, partial [Pirellulaceae bacterium]
MCAAQATSSLDTVPIFSAGKWIECNTDRTSTVFNPSTGQAIAQVPMCSAEDTGRVVQSAVDALPTWKETPVVERARLMFRLRQIMEQRFDEIAALVTREHGKTLAESRAEVQRTVEMVEFAAGIPAMITGETMPNIAAEVDAETIRHPVGVCVGITPYNFPSMVPMWMIPVALVCGNTFVLKPSEKTPLSAVLIGELLCEAGLPDGVFNIVHGDKECVDALLTHPDVAAISFV